MTKLGTYTFLPWLRQGIANQIDNADGDMAIKTRVSIKIALNLKGDPVEGTTKLEQEIPQDIELYGPGDIVGIDTKAILKVEPRNWITNFETNFLPYIDFYDEDFPWRYTPAQPNAANINRLRPWIMLVVLTEDEFQDGSGGGDRPLPYITVEDVSVFPPSANLWAWAHVHVNKSLIAGPSDMVVEASENSSVMAQFEQILKQDPDLAYSRIVAPRKLSANTAYHAFLMPVFETGRLAGLGLDPSAAPYATHCAWDAYPGDPASPRQDSTAFPFYHRWYFRTSTVGDFEYLVRLLQPKPMDSRVGRRDIDVQYPDDNMTGIDDPELGGILKLGGALQIPNREQDVWDNWPQSYPSRFQSELAAFINLAEGYSRQEAEVANSDPDLPDPINTDPDPDPLITPPLYGRWHAKIDRLLSDTTGADLPQNANWIHDLNLDPQFRVVAGLGTEVIKLNQEAYMDAAWGQVGEILKANQQIRWGQVAKEISWIWYDRHLRPLQETDTDRFFALTAPLDRRILVEGTTRFHTVSNSIVPRAVVAAPMRRLMRPRSRLVQRLNFSPDLPPANLVTRLNAKDVLPAPPKITPPSLPTPNQIAEEMLPDLPEGVLDGIRRVPRWLRNILFALIILIALIVTLVLGPIGVIYAFVAMITLWVLDQNARQTEVADSIKEENQTPERVGILPQSPDFTLTPPNQNVEFSQGNSDSAEATRFKIALKEAYQLIQASKQVAQVPPRLALDLPTMSTRTFEAIDPDLTIPRSTFTTVFIPPRIKDALFEIFEEAMAYPEFDLPMYKPLVALSDELFLPNLQYIEANSISLLEPNQPFIEAYMVGLNHEFARELLWREYPTDQRGSYFRQFWDPSGFLDRNNTDNEALREQLRDIPPLHQWSRFSNLGDHDHRDAPGNNDKELVLVIRGELLKKYPTAVIYAQRANWERVDGQIDKTKPRVLAPLAVAEEDNPPTSKLRTPLYEAKVEPDIYFFGFDLTVEEARGNRDADPPSGEDAGWFFVIKERPGEPRFGFDIDQEGTEGGIQQYWNDLTWENVLPGALDGSFIEPTQAPGITLTEPPVEDEVGQQQHVEDVQVEWTGSVSAAEMAYIMYQVPVLVAVHASEMLPE